MKVTLILFLIIGVLPVILKGIIHVMLDVRNGYKVDFARSKGYVYFLPYKKNVSEKDEKLKSQCNALQRISKFSLATLAIVFFVHYISNL